MMLRYCWSGDVETEKRSLSEIVADGMMPQKQNDGTVRLTNRIKRREANRRLAGVYTKMEDGSDADA